MAMSNKRPSAAQLDADRAIVVALQDLPGYVPTNPAYSVEALRERVSFLNLSEEAEIRAKRAYEVAREQSIDAAKGVHSLVQETKIQVLAQYGSDSPVVHAVGLKQRSERKRPTRRG
ncbi:hypothetical protein K2Z83_21310 [Oscillochloris sp. ZM17-4]|uniref:hypothetical protein n=1 Tax=Oscillochloris sp. ZM17-4 TaxID=2866714 RepID=UPI001C72AF39|nr:hypothetical protein [Oscillochloris sp. ZM17-4]MBX0330212.1 hypothetical protein [Oscillochloris sp. ZM17-4]